MEIELSRPNSQMIQTVDDLARIGKMMAVSGYFTDARDAAQASVKIMAGMEMGFGAFASMTGIYIISGKPSVGANLMASAVKSNPRYDYRVSKMTDTEVSIDFFEMVDGKRENIGNSTFTAAEAKKAGVKNMDKYPRNMLFARAMSNGIRWFCPDVFSGNATYTPEELGATVDGDGYVIDAPQNAPEQPVTVEAVVAPITEGVKAEKPAETPEKPKFDEGEFLRKWSRPANVPAMSRLNAEKMTDHNGEPYGEKTTETLFHMLNAISKKIKTGSEAERDTYGLKVSAICEILDVRKAELTIDQADDDPFVSKK